MILLDLSYHSEEYELLFVKIGARVPDLAWYIFMAQVTKMLLLGPRLEVYQFFWNFMILLDSSYDSGEYEILFLKIGARCPDFWLRSSSGPKPSKSSF